jgi:tetratricopeptide (TPR) repeat protein
MSQDRHTGRFQHLEFDDQPLRLDLETEQEQLQKPGGVLNAAAMDRHAYHERALQALQRGEFEPALKFFTRTLELDRTFVPAWVGQVQMLIELEELREADLWAQKALDLFRDQGDLLSARAVAQARRKERQAAMGASDAGIAARGASAYRWLARGEVLLACGNAADSCFDRAMLEPDADWYTGLWAARIYRRYGRHTNALVLARKATETAPQAPFTWYIRGLCERDLAISAYATSLERALEVDATFLLARKALRDPASAFWLTRLFRRIRGS